VRPSRDPLGLDVVKTGRLLHRAFDEQLVAAGGSLPMWLILIALKGGDHTMQRDLATSIGIEDATLTHHLNRMARDGLIERHRDPTNRRNQVVTLTDSGEALFGSLLTTVTTFDHRVRAGFSATEVDTLQQLLARLRTNLEEDAAR
jgi:MarR family transcriptional regulator for hemolysin